MKRSLDSSLLESLLTMASFVEARDAYTGGHTWRVSQYGRLLAEKLGLDSSGLFLVQVGGLVHDLGKIGVPDGVLNKPEKLTEPEMDIIRQHPAAGASVLKSHPLYDLVSAAILEHHERYDGSGYPDKRNGSDLTIIGRILAVADSFDAMTSTRAYRQGLSAEQALEQIRLHGGTQFDPAVATTFQELGNSGALEHILGHAAEEQLMLNCPKCGPILVPPEHPVDGETIGCHSCGGTFTLHADGETFQLEMTGMSTPTMPPLDTRTVRSVLREAPRRIEFREYLPHR
jgi:putative nucleotidyltransferase with HDIG domain